jgi:hypothetical protein
MKIEQAKPKFMRHNINEHVKIKLTTLGKTILWNRFKDMNELLISRGCAPHAGPAFKEDENGYYEMQMWDFIETFAQYIGIAKTIPLEPIILIEVRECDDE